jgi:DNA-binding PadR family transcriptional regulator
MMVRGLIERDQAASRYALTEHGRAVLAALLEKGDR